METTSLQEEPPGDEDTNPTFKTPPLSWVYCNIHLSLIDYHSAPHRFRPATLASMLEQFCTRTTPAASPPPSFLSGIPSSLSQTCSPFTSVSVYFLSTNLSCKEDKFQTFIFSDPSLRIITTLSTQRLFLDLHNCSSLHRRIYITKDWIWFIRNQGRLYVTRAGYYPDPVVLSVVRWWLGGQRQRPTLCDLSWLTSS